MRPVVAIYAQGTMGAGIAGVLTANGISVITCLEGRSADSAKRAHTAGMEAVAFDQLSQSRHPAVRSAARRGNRLRGKRGPFFAKGRA